MPEIKFIRDFDWKPVPGYTTAYKAGMVALVTTACAKTAIATGRAEAVVAPRRKPEPKRRRHARKET